MALLQTVKLGIKLPPKEGLSHKTFCTPILLSLRQTSESSNNFAFCHQQLQITHICKCLKGGRAFCPARTNLSASCYTVTLQCYITFRGVWTSVWLTDWWKKFPLSERIFEGCWELASTRGMFRQLSLNLLPGTQSATTSLIPPH